MTAGLGSDLVGIRYVRYEMPEDDASPQSQRESLFPALVSIERAIIQEQSSSSKSRGTRKRDVIPDLSETGVRRNRREADPIKKSTESSL